MSLVSKLESFGEEVKTVVELAATDTAKAAAWLAEHGGLIQSITSLASPAAAAIEGSAFALYKQLAETVSNAGAAAAANGISVPLDKAIVQTLQADWAAIKNFKL